MWNSFSDEMAAILAAILNLSKCSSVTKSTRRILKMDHLGCQNHQEQTYQDISRFNPISATLSPSTELF